MVHFCIYPYVFGVSQSIERILNSTKLLHHQKIQYGRQDCCRSGYYSNSVHSYPREIILVFIPSFVQVAEHTGTTPTAIGWLSHCSIQRKRSSSLKYKDIADLKEATLVEVDHHK